MGGKARDGLQCPCRASTSNGSGPVETMVPVNHEAGQRHDTCSEPCPLGPWESPRTHRFTAPEGRRARENARFSMA